MSIPIEPVQPYVSDHFGWSFFNDEANVRTYNGTAKQKAHFFLRV